MTFETKTALEIFFFILRVFLKLIKVRKIFLYQVLFLFLIIFYFIFNYDFLGLSNYSGSIYLYIFIFFPFFYFIIISYRYLRRFPLFNPNILNLFFIESLIAYLVSLVLEIKIFYNWDENDKIMGLLLNFILITIYFIYRLGSNIKQLKISKKDNYFLFFWKNLFFFIMYFLLISIPIYLMKYFKSEDSRFYYFIFLTFLVITLLVKSFYWAYKLTKIEKLEDYEEDFEIDSIQDKSKLTT